MENPRFSVFLLRQGSRFCLENAQQMGALGIKRGQTPTIRRTTPPSDFGFTAGLPKPDLPPFCGCPHWFCALMSRSGTRERVEPVGQTRNSAR